MGVIFLFFLQRFQRNAGSFLLGPLFAAAFSLADLLTVERYRHHKALIMIRTGLADQFVGENLVFFLLLPLFVHFLCIL